MKGHSTHWCYRPWSSLLMKGHSTHWCYRPWSSLLIAILVWLGAPLRRTFKFVLELYKGHLGNCPYVKEKKTNSTYHLIARAMYIRTVWLPPSLTNMYIKLWALRSLSPWPLSLTLDLRIVHFPMGSIRTRACMHLAMARRSGGVKSHWSFLQKSQIKQRQYCWLESLRLVASGIKSFPVSKGRGFESNPSIMHIFFFQNSGK